MPVSGPSVRGRVEGLGHLARRIKAAPRPYNGCMSGERPARLPERDRPWMMRTYAGHSTAKASNELYRRNLAKGQTGLSIAFDLPTQTGYDPDDELARGEVGKVGVPVSHRGDMAALMDGIPLGEMNTSMTINATAAWLLALYIVTAEEQGVAQDQLQGTTQNDIIKEFLARGHLRLPAGALDAADRRHDRLHGRARPASWNPINICSYHLQEAGATPVQEIAYAMSNAIAVLDAARERVRARAHGTGLRADLVLRQRRRALRRGAREAARDVDPVGADRAPSATASRTRATCASATGCRSTRWA